MPHFCETGHILGVKYNTDEFVLNDLVMFLMYSRQPQQPRHDRRRENHHD